MTVKSFLAAASFATFAAVGVTPASAATVISLAENLGLTPPSIATFITVSCTGTCTGVVGSAGATSLSATDADAYIFSPHNEATIASFFSTLLDITPALTSTDVTKTNVPAGDGGEDFTFTGVSGYFFVKYGEWTSFLFADGTSDVTFEKGPRGPAGLSNYGTIDYDGGGVTTPVPLPAGLPLLLSGMALAGVVARRKSRKA